MGVERLLWNALDDLDVGVVLCRDGKPAVRRLSGRRDHPVGELGLKCQYERSAGWQKSERDRRRDPVRQVRDTGRKGRQRYVERVSLDHLKGARLDGCRELCSQERGERRISFDNGNPSGRRFHRRVVCTVTRVCEQPVGEGAGSTTDLEEVACVSGFREVRRESVEHAIVDEEVLIAVGVRLGAGSARKAVRIA